MRAAELTEHIPTVRRDTTGAEAARVIAEYRLSGLVVVDDAGVPLAVIPGSQLLGLVLPTWVREDPRLAHAYGEGAADKICQALNEATLGDLLDSKRLTGTKPPAVRPDDTLLEIAAVMDQAHLPLVLVVDESGDYQGALTLSRVLAAMAQAAGQDSDLVQARLHHDIVGSAGEGGTAAEPDSEGDR